MVVGVVDIRTRIHQQDLVDIIAVHEHPRGPVNIPAQDLPLVVVIIVRGRARDGILLLNTSSQRIVGGLGNCSLVQVSEGPGFAVFSR
jgi:hypothetical protein